MTERKSFWLTSNGIASMVLIAVATYFLLVEHREHVFPFLPYLIILLCPLMHVFMHRGHGHGHGVHSEKEDRHNPQEEYVRGYEDALKERDARDDHDNH